MNTCGRCKWAKPIPLNLQMRQCMYGPPQIVVLPVQTPKGVAMTTQMHRPNVGVGDEAPSCFSPGFYGVEGLVIDQEDTQIVPAGD